MCMYRTISNTQISMICSFLLFICIVLPSLTSKRFLIDLDTIYIVCACVYKGCSFYNSPLFYIYSIYNNNMSVCIYIIYYVYLSLYNMHVYKFRHHHICLKLQLHDIYAAYTYFHSYSDICIYSYYLYISRTLVLFLGGTGASLKKFRVPCVICASFAAYK